MVSNYEVVLTWVSADKVPKDSIFEKNRLLDSTGNLPVVNLFRVIKLCEIKVVGLSSPMANRET